MTIQAGMNIAAHSTVISANTIAGVCENYLVKKTGVPECLHKTPQKIMAL
jgi:hypothetical protein